MNSHPYLIVGAGLAGLTLANNFRKKGIPFLLSDDPAQPPSSPVAAGMYSPLGGKRFQLNTYVEKKLDTLYQLAADMKQWLGKDYLVKAPVIQAFGNTKETNDFYAKLDEPRFRKYVDDAPVFKSPLTHPFGVYATLESGWMKTDALVTDSVRQYEREGLLLKEALHFPDLRETSEGWQWNDKLLKGIIFCEGYGIRNNPFFSWIPFKWAKGQILLIESNDLVPDEVIKRSVYVVHQHHNIYKVGATYEWDFADANPTEAGRQFLESKLKEMGNFSFEVVDHFAAVRPATKDRNPVLGKHPDKKGLYVCNGLGAKGVLQAPYTAHVFAEWLKHETAIPSSLDVQRFKTIYSSGQQR